ncbi:hypothetical protein KXD40_008731 [Peronospora effusa]|uniref:Uncharacterized protein n=1 Tax=Peronospora effusa TaxID=542832 RepID=A0A3M6VV78_9STRA|nr:hypothetical protein DD238_006338 [Peronospora effusa]UIZ22078.1 hypothetical protein KXD40_008731 [Peronospora effusa]
MWIVRASIFDNCCLMQRGMSLINRLRAWSFVTLMRHQPHWVLTCSTSSNFFKGATASSIRAYAHEESPSTASIQLDKIWTKNSAHGVHGVLAKAASNMNVEIHETRLQQHCQSSPNDEVLKHTTPSVFTPFTEPNNNGFTT